MTNKEKPSGIKEMWAFKVELAKYIKFIKPSYEISLPKDCVKDALYSHIAQIATDTIYDFYWKQTSKKKIKHEILDKRIEDILK